MMEKEITSPSSIGRNIFVVLGLFFFSCSRVRKIRSTMYRIVPFGWWSALLERSRN